MHVILVPGKRNGSGQTISLSNRQLLAIVAVGVVLLPTLAGIVAYRLNEMWERQQGSPMAVAFRDELVQSRTVLAEARAESSRHLNALAQRLGTLQAQVLRLNALGTRLTRMAGLDAREFSFDSAPAMGGPERNVSYRASAPDVVGNLGALERELERSQARLVALESLLLDRKLIAAVTPSAWPVDGGWISSGFGVRMDPFTGHQSAHEGVDVAARFGSPIYATGDGVVNHAGEKSGYGLVVEVTHDASLVTRYAHASAVLVKVGDRVKRGDEIARVGTTGRSTGPHLHFEVLYNGQAANPTRYLHQGAVAARTATPLAKTALSQ
jgi:murein DD-endopeptidase MepM/ murein hydrolase activator NlpD